MKNIEFSITGDGSTIMVHEGKAPHVLSVEDHELIKFFHHLIESRFPNAYIALKEEYGQYVDFKYRAVCRFIKCNWGNDDEIKDIDETGALNFEHVRCPLRGGFCIWEDTLCHPDELTILSDRETEVLKLYATGNSLKEVARKLFISVRTVECHRDSIYRKLDVKSQSQLTQYAHKHKII